MKFAIAALLGYVSAASIHQKLSNQINASKNEMITIELNQREYTGEHQQEANQYSGLTQQDSKELTDLIPGFSLA